MFEEIKALVLHKRNEILIEVKEYIINFLNTFYVKFFEHLQDDFTEVKSIAEVLHKLSITEQEYETALKMSDDNGFQLHLRRPTV